MNLYEWHSLPQQLRNRIKFRLGIGTSANIQVIDGRVEDDGVREANLGSISHLTPEQLGEITSHPETEWLSLLAKEVEIVSPVEESKTEEPKVEVKPEVKEVKKRGRPKKK